MEVEITCLVNYVHISDLGKSLFKGDVLYLPLEKYENSKDLEVLVRAGGVSTKKVMRYKQVRESIRPSNPPNTPTKPFPAAPLIPALKEISIEDRIEAVLKRVLEEDRRSQAAADNSTAPSKKSSRKKT